MPYKDPDKQREYLRKYGRQWYAKNRKAHQRRVAVNNERKRQWFQELKTNLKCERCSENHPAVLDFHHENPKKKDFNLGRAVRNGIGRDRIMAEIAKCTCLCSNCHRKLHWEQKQEK